MDRGGSTRRSFWERVAPHWPVVLGVAAVTALVLWLLSVGRAA